MPAEKQLSVFLPNRPGQLARLCQTLAAAKVNIRAISVNDSVDEGIVRIVVDKTKRAAGVVAAEGLSSVESDVLVISLKNQPGALEKVAGNLAKAKINIEYIYGSAAKKGERALAVLRVSNLKKALKVLGR